MRSLGTLDWMLLLLRWVFGFRIFYGVIDNVVSWDRMLEFEQFLNSNGFPFPLVSAVVSVYVQFLSSLSWMAGYKVKISSLLMIINFLVALFGFHIAAGDTYLGMAPAIHLLSVSIFLFAVGGGNASVDHWLGKKRSKS